MAWKCLCFFPSLKCANNRSQRKGIHYEFQGLKGRVSGDGRVLNQTAVWMPCCVGPDWGRHIGFHSAGVPSLPSMAPCPSSQTFQHLPEPSDLGKTCPVMIDSWVASGWKFQVHATISTLNTVLEFPLSGDLHNFCFLLQICSPMLTLQMQSPLKAPGLYEFKTLAYRPSDSHWVWLMGTVQ